MKTIESVIGRDLQWVQPNFFKPEFELRNLNTVVATLKLKHLLSEHATAESADGCWKLKRSGFLRTSITVATCDNDEPLTTVQGKRWKKQIPIPLPDGTQVALVTDLWGWKFALKSPTGETIAEILRTGFFSGAYKLTLNRSAASYKDLPWLVMFLWYTMTLYRRRQHAAG